MTLRPWEIDRRSGTNYGSSNGSGTTASGNRGSTGSNYWTDVTSRMGTSNTLNPTALSIWQSADKYTPNRQMGGNTATALAQATRSLNGGSPMGMTGGGRGGRGGGGGGGIAPPTMDQADLDILLRLYGKARPQDLAFTPFEHDFYDYDGSQFDKMRTGIATAYDADTASGNTSFDEGQAALDLLAGQRPYEAAFGRTPQMDSAMQNMLAANGVGGYSNTEGAQADAAFQRMAAGLQASQNIYNQLSQMGLEGDRRGFNERMAAGRRADNLGVDLAAGQHKTAYDQSKWQHLMNVAMQNWNRQNQVSDANIQAGNTFDAGMLDPITQLMMAYPDLNFAGAEGLIA